MSTVPDHIAVSRLDLPADPVTAMPLSGAEQASLAACRTDRRRREIEVSRRLMRYGLRRYLTMPDDAVVWQERGPRYAGGRREVRLSAAHSTGHAAVAISPHGSIGIDIESTAHPRRWGRIMKVMFCAEDVEWITHNAGTLGDAMSGLRCFLAVWTAREAYAKYRGSSVLDGLSAPLLRDARSDAGVAAGRDSGDGRVEVLVADDWVAAVCRAPRDTMPRCMIGVPGDRDELSPYRADFVFLAGGSH